MVNTKKCFKQKLYGSEGGHKEVPSIWPWMASSG